MPPGFLHFEENPTFIGRTVFLSEFLPTHKYLSSSKFGFEIFPTYISSFCFSALPAEVFRYLYQFSSYFKKREFLNPTNPAIHRKCPNFVSSISTLQIRISTSKFFCLTSSICASLPSQRNFFSICAHSGDSPGTYII